MTIQAEATARKYLTLVEVSRVIASHRDVSELFEALTECLHRLLTFNYLSVVVHDDKRNVMRTHILHSTSKPADTVGREFATSDSYSGMVWETQQLLNVRDVSTDARFPRVKELLRERSVRSFCSFPLTTAHRRVGALAIGRAEVGGFDPTDIEFGGLVAAQVAVALDNALHYEEGVGLQTELKRERDRLQLVLDVNNSVVSNLKLRDLFRGLSSSLRRVVAYDSASLLLPDPQVQNMLRIHALDFPDGRGYLQEDLPVPVISSNPGRVFLTGQPLMAEAGRARFLLPIPTADVLTPRGCAPA